MEEILFSSVLHALRSDRGISQAELSALAEVGQNTVQRMESASNEPRPSTTRLVLQALARVRPFSGHEIERLRDATGLPPRELEAMNEAAARVRLDDASDPVGQELAAIYRLLGPEQALLFLRAFRACLQQSHHLGLQGVHASGAPTLEESLVQRARKIAGSPDAAAKAIRDALGRRAVSVEVEADDPSNAQRLYEASLGVVAPGGRNQRGNRMIPVRQPPKPGPEPGMVVEEIHWYEEGPSEEGQSSDSMPPKEAP